MAVSNEEILAKIPSGAKVTLKMSDGTELEGTVTDAGIEGVTLEDHDGKIDTSAIDLIDVDISPGGPE